MKTVVASINFSPDHAGIGVYSSDFPLFLEESGDEVTVVTGFPYYPRWHKREEDKRRLFAAESHHGVRVLRGYLYVPQGKLNAVRRFLHEVSFSAFAFLNFLRAGRADSVVVFTPPLFLALVAVIFKWLWRAKLVINVQDLPLDAAVALGMMKRGFLARVFESLEAWTYRRADMVCSISDSMVATIASKGVKPERLFLVPNWIDAHAAARGAEAGNFLPRFPEAANKFTVAYAGNIGVKQGVDVLIRVAKKLEAETNLHVFMIGEGADKSNLMTQAAELNVKNVTFLPFLDPAEYQSMLSDVDVIFVAQRSGAGNNFFPSKLLGLMARSKPLLVAADPESELARVVADSECGLVSPYDDVSSIAASIRQLMSMRDSLDAMGKRGFESVLQFDREIVLSKWRADILRL
ncbi:Glycosyltransferase [Rhodopirellula islandica]|uniref:Glycosyltransferase n=1 Tax=Rhodopirellula islandica TaxID=595434 RepID=A0A0J1E749_RHOIS|nr:glycosyltransferase family 4 protein [Rhodopirellula islandica]KLU01284.1 Glycosyltransferase [Rhodopirellula islandica]